MLNIKQESAPWVKIFFYHAWVEVLCVRSDFLKVTPILCLVPVYVHTDFLFQASLCYLRFISVLNFSRRTWESTRTLDNRTRKQNVFTFIVASSFCLPCADFF
jgi:hypothetical protein